MLANARSRVLFQLAPDDAAVLARGHADLTPLDLAALGPYEVFASLQAGGSVTPYMSGVTLPAGPPTADAVALRAACAGRYGQPRDEVEAELRRIVGGPTAGSSGPIGSRPRRSS